MAYDYEAIRKRLHPEFQRIFNTDKLFETDDGKELSRLLNQLKRDFVMKRLKHLNLSKGTAYVIGDALSKASREDDDIEIVGVKDQTGNVTHHKRMVRVHIGTKVLRAMGCRDNHDTLEVELKLLFPSTIVTGYHVKSKRSRRVFIDADEVREFERQQVEQGHVTEDDIVQFTILRSWIWGEMKRLEDPEWVPNTPPAVEEKPQVPVKKTPIVRDAIAARPVYGPLELELTAMDELLTDWRQELDIQPSEPTSPTFIEERRRCNTGT